MQNAKFIRVPEVAEMANVSTPTVYRWTSERRIPYYKPTNGRLYFKREDIEAFLLNGLVESL